MKWLGVIPTAYDGSNQTTLRDFRPRLWHVIYQNRKTNLGLDTLPRIIEI